MAAQDTPSKPSPGGEGRPEAGRRRDLSKVTPRRKTAAERPKEQAGADGTAVEGPEADPRRSIPGPHIHGVETGASIPPHYGEDRLGVLVRDANWLHCYWELEGGACQRIIDAKGKAYLDAARWVLRVTPRGGSPYEVSINPGRRSWYLEVGECAGCRVEIGLRGPDGAYSLIADGGEVRTPPRPADEGAARGGKRLGEELEHLRGYVGIGASWMSLGSRGYLQTLRATPRTPPAGGARGPTAADLPNGYLLIVLHAHLPYVRHPEYERFLEEDWLFEAITETYVPLAEMFTRLADEGVRVRAAMTLSPTLCEMMVDPLLQRRYSAHLERLIACADAALARMRGTPYRGAAEMYCRRLRQIRTAYYSWDRNLVAAFRALADRGLLDIVTSAATHGILPLVRRRESLRAQVETGCANYERHFGRRPRGVWLPECAYASGVEEVLAQSGLQYFFLDAHGLLNATPQPRALTYRPVVTPAGVAAFARDPETGIMVWSAEQGFPGDPVYREFYRDLGYDGEYEVVRPCLHADGVRRNIGLKYHRVTGKVPLERKEPYVPDWARRCSAGHADHFVSMNEGRTSYLRGILGSRPVICAMYDAELFGHWWYEGIDFLEHVFRRSTRAGSGIEPATPQEYLAREKALEQVRPSASSWGDKGYYEHWLNESNDWIYPHLHKAEERMHELVTGRPAAEGLERRALKQAARELLLAQSSDWAFLMTTGTAMPYAIRRTRDHLAQFTRLYEMLRSGGLDEKELDSLERRDALFREIDYGVYAGP